MGKGPPKVGGEDLKMGFEDPKLGVEAPKLGENPKVGCGATKVG